MSYSKKSSISYIKISKVYFYVLHIWGVPVELPISRFEILVGEDHKHFRVISDSLLTVIQHDLKQHHSQHVTRCLLGQCQSRSNLEIISSKELLILRACSPRGHR